MLNKKMRRPLSAEQKRMRWGYVFCLPLIFGLFAMFIPHMVQTAIFTLNSVETTPEGYEMTWIGIQNYKKALGNLQFLIPLKDSLINLFSTLPVIIIFSLFMAVVLNQQFKGRFFMRTIFFIPVLLATGVVMSIEKSSNLFQMVSNNTVNTGTVVDLSQVEGIKNVLMNLNFNDTLIKIVVGTADSIYTIVQASGIQIMVLLAGLQEISPSLYEAAKVEGCDGWSLFWKITFPIISPQLVVCGVYTIVDSYGANNAVSTYITDKVMSMPTAFGYAAAMNFIYFAIVGAAIFSIGMIVSKFVHFEND